MANLKELIVSGSASVVGKIFGTFVGNLTGNVTGNLTGTASSATKATVADGQTLYRARSGITDANGLRVTARGMLDELTTTTTNAPEAQWFHYYTSGSTDVGYGSQLALGMTSKNMYFRNYNSSTWGAWKKIAFTDSDITGNAATATKATQDASGNVITTTYATKTELNGKQATLTAAQLNAANSGITSAKVSTYDGYATTIAGKADSSSLATVATSGKYSDLTGTPTIPAAVTESTVSGWGFTKNAGTVTKVNNVAPDANGNVSLTIPAAVTESTVSGWGFTKNTGTYSKPSTGIPKTDLASAVQTSLGKADTALQEHQSLDSCVKTTGNQTIAGTKAFSSTISGSVNGSADVSKFLGNHAETASSTTGNDPTAGMAKTSGLFLTGTYNDSATPSNYGNIINVAGAGTGQLLCEWSGSDNTTGKLYYRSHRDTKTGGWGAWKTVAYTDSSITGNAATATKATQDASGNVITSTYATKTQLGTKQDTLVSGTNIKTINGGSILGEGDILVSTYRPPMLQFIWSDHKINDIQWLRGDTFSWQSGDVYVAAYDKLVEEFDAEDTVDDSEGGVTFKRSKNGFKIATEDQESIIFNKYKTDGMAWFFILDKTNKRFKLPRTKYGFEGVRDVVGNDVIEHFTTDTSTLKKNGTQMYLYFYVGQFSQPAIEQTAGLSAELFADKLDRDFSNATVKPITTKQVTRGITRAPQNIKLELNNGTLTLKAGSVVCIPNGFETDGVTPKFDEYTIPNDLSRLGITARTSMTIYASGYTGSAFLSLPPEYCTSGETAPTSFYGSGSTGLAIWYDTKNNLLKWTENRGTTWGTGSFPFGIQTETTSGYTSIDQTFHSVGYIGATVFARKGVGAVIPNGLNEDGTLKNIEVTLERTLVCNIFNLNVNSCYAVLSYADGNVTLERNTLAVSNFDPIKNIDDRADGLLLYSTPVALVQCLQGKIVRCDLSTPMSLLKYSDKPDIIAWSFPGSNSIDLTLGASGAAYTATANGWLTWSGDVGFMSMVNDKNYLRTSVIGNGNDVVGLSMPMKKGDRVVVNYRNLLATVTFSFVYADGN